MTLIGYYALVGISLALFLSAIYLLVSRHLLKWKAEMTEQIAQELQDKQDALLFLPVENQESLSLNDYQSAALKTAMYPNRGSNIDYPALGLNGEAGEVADIVKKISRDSGGYWDEGHKAKIKKEMGDVLWYLAVGADEFGLSLSEIAAANIEKLASRKARGVIQGSGDDR